MNMRKLLGGQNANPFLSLADKREFIKISQAVGVGFLVMGAVGFIIKLSKPYFQYILGFRRSFASCWWSPSNSRVLTQTLTVHIPVNNILVGGAWVGEILGEVRDAFNWDVWGKNTSPRYSHELAIPRMASTCIILDRFWSEGSIAHWFKGTGKSQFDLLSLEYPITNCLCTEILPRFLGVWFGLWSELTILRSDFSSFKIAGVRLILPPYFFLYVFYRFLVFW